MPKQPKDKHYLQHSIESVEGYCPDNTAVIILTKQFGDVKSPVAYVSNCSREDAIKCLKEFLFRIGEAEDWMKHID